MTIRNTTNQNQTWTTQQFISLSRNLSQAYGNNSQDVKAVQKDFWTTDKFISMSQHLSSAYGVDM